MIFGDTATSILDQDFNLFRALILGGGYGDATHLVGHGLSGVQQKVEEHFLQLLSICNNIQILRNLGEDFHSRRQLAGNKSGGPDYQVFKVNPTLLEFPLPGKFQ